MLTGNLHMPCKFHTVNVVSVPAKSVIHFLLFHWLFLRRRQCKQIAKSKALKIHEDERAHMRENGRVNE